MSMIEVSKPMQQSHAADPAELEEQMCEVVRDSISPARKSLAESGSDVGADGTNGLLRQLAGTTFEEIEKLIDGLQGLRVHLQGEGERVQREIVKYAQLSQAAMKSTKVIAEGMSRLHSSSETS
jgi:hypothetical protein